MKNHKKYLSAFTLQVFGLARDPAADNNWKVKYTEARLADKTVHEQPSLANSTLCAMAYS